MISGARTSSEYSFGPSRFVISTHMHHESVCSANNPSVMSQSRQIKTTLWPRSNYWDNPLAGRVLAKHGIRVAQAFDDSHIVNLILKLPKSLMIGSTPLSWKRIEQRLFFLIVLSCWPPVQISQIVPPPQIASEQTEIPSPPYLRLHSLKQYRYNLAIYCVTVRAIVQCWP